MHETMIDSNHCRISGLGADDENVIPDRSYCNCSFNLWISRGHQWRSADLCLNLRTETSMSLMHPAVPAELPDCAAFKKTLRNNFIKIKLFNIEQRSLESRLHPSTNSSRGTAVC
jgi:hypothetical protein